MSVDETKNNVPSWMYFLGMLLFLMGIFGALRMAHIEYRGVPYPSHGVLPATILAPTSTFTFGRESDCDAYPTLYYELDGKTTRPATVDEKNLQEENTKRCVNGFNEDRAKQKQDDKNLSVFLIFTGLGLILSRRFVRE